jgi:hypothetical protein
VVKVVVWHRAQPAALNSVAPFCAEGVSGAGAGGADRRMNNAKLTTSEDISLAVPVELPLEFSMLVASSDELLKTQPDAAERSFGKTSFETPCSTL